jgi:protoporphyrinogen/coproporphyrinogen III oxidase
VLVTLVYDRQDVPGELDASGFLVPRDAGLFLTAASFGSSKWAHWDDGRHIVLRASAGHSRDDRPDRMSDDEIVAAIREDLGSTLGLAAEPLAVRVSRYPAGFAQYGVGHLERVERIEAALAEDHARIVLAGAAYRGVGIPACIRQGRAAVRRIDASDPAGQPPPISRR